MSLTRYLVIMFISLAFFLFEGFQIASMNTLVPFIKNELNLSITFIGLISSLYYFTICSMLLPAGILLDQYGPWKIYPVAFLLSAIGMLVFSFSSSIVFILASRVISGGAASFALLGGIKIARSSLILEDNQRVLGDGITSQQRVQFAITVILASHIFGDMLAQMPFTWLISNLGWRNALSTIASIAIIISMLSLLILSQLQQQINIHDELPKKISFQAILKIAYNPTIWLGALTVIMFELPILMLGTFFGHIFLITVYDLSSLTVGGVFSMLYAALMVSSLLFSYFWRNTSIHLILIIVYSTLSLLSILCIFYIKPLMNHYPYLPFITLAIGASIQNVGYFALVERNDKDTLALANSCMSLIIVFLATIARPLVGYIIEYECYPDCKDKILSILDYQRGGLCLILFVLIGLSSLLSLYCTESSSRSL